MALVDDVVVVAAANAAAVVAVVPGPAAATVGRWAPFLARFGFSLSFCLLALLARIG